MNNINNNRRNLIKALGAAAVTLPFASWVSAEVANRGGKKLGLAMVGLGSYATKQIAVGLQKSDYWNITGIVTGTPSKIPDWKQKWQIKNENIFNYDNFDKIIESKDIDAVYICLPNSMHAEFTIRAAKAGKHVICEKPMAVSVIEAEQMVKACDDAGVKLAIGYRLHFNAHHKQVMEWSRKKTFGPVKYVNANFGFAIGNPDQWRLKKALAGGGPLMDVGIYCVQAARYATGEEPVSIKAQFAPVTDPIKFKEVEEGISWQMHFPSGAYMTGFSGYNSYIDELYVGTSQKSFKIEPAYSYGPLSGQFLGGEKIDFPHMHHQFMQMEGMGPLFLSDQAMPDHISGIEGLKDMKILMAIYESARTGKEVRL